MFLLNISTDTFSFVQREIMDEGQPEFMETRGHNNICLNVGIPGGQKMPLAKLWQR